MEPEEQDEMSEEVRFCPECGAEEGGYFCRKCGALLRGEEMVLCPRCHHVVPSGEFCNRCGQSLGRIALNLRQLALAGGDFWVSAMSPPSLPSSEAQQSFLGPDDSVALDAADLPDWLQELSVESAPPEIQAHVYPSLQPMEEEEDRPRRVTLLLFILLGVLLSSLVVAAVLLLLQGW